MPKLILTTEAQGKVAYEFAERSITIGRAPDNMIVIDDPSVSNRHAQLELSGETYRLKDLDSTAAPSGFGNASPFRQRSTSRDPLRLVVLSMAAIALLTFLGSMLAVLLIRAP